MFYWGRDVVTDGNLLLRCGFQKRPSPGLQGTSCYRLPWESGFIELHGACAGWYAAEGSGQPGFLFVRAEQRCFAHSLTEAVVPGDYDWQKLRGGDWQRVMQAARHFARWLCEYEKTVTRLAGPAHRRACREMLRKLERGRPWLPPDTALPWLRRFAAGDPALPRARALTHV